MLEATFDENSESMFPIAHDTKHELWETWILRSHRTLFQANSNEICQLFNKTITLRSVQEYLTGPLDKKPARQAGIELAGKVKH